jgi:hypothetical protein
VDLFPLEGDRDLQVVTGNCFVKSGGLRFDPAPLLRFVRVDEKYRRTAAVLGRWIVFVRPVLLSEFRVALDDDVGLRQESEGLVDARLGARERGLRPRD